MKGLAYPKYYCTSGWRPLPNMAWTEEAAKAPIFSVTVFILLTSKLGVYTEFKIMKGLDHSKDYIEIECTPPLNLVGMEVASNSAK